MLLPFLSQNTSAPYVEYDADRPSARDYNFPMSIAFMFALLSFLAYLGESGVLVWLHAKPTGYNLVRHAVSDYGVGKTRRLFTIYLALAGLGSVLLAVAFMFGPEAPIVPQRTIVFLLLLAIARIGVILFPTDLEGKPLTRTGILHYFFAIVSIGFTYTIMAELTPIFLTIPDWQVVAGILNVLLMIATPALVALVITLWKPLRNIFGLFERLFIVSTTIWFLFASAFLAVLLH
jgi:hypothetical protein